MKGIRNFTVYEGARAGTLLEEWYSQSEVHMSLGFHHTTTGRFLDIGNHSWSQGQGPLRASTIGVTVNGITSRDLYNPRCQCKERLKEQGDIDDHNLLKLADSNDFAKVVNLNASGSMAGDRDGKRITPLHWAVMRRDIPGVQALLDAGANIEDNNNNNLRPLVLASKMGYADVVTYLLQRGAYINADNGLALHWAAALGHVEVTVVLVYAGADLEAKADNRVHGKKTPLCMAALADQTPVMRVLLRGGASMGICCDEKHYTALHYAAGNGHLNAVEVLYNYGADRSAKDVNGQTPYDRAVDWGFTYLYNTLKP